MTHKQEHDKHLEAFAAIADHARIYELEKMLQCHDMDSAPKDGSRILCWFPLDNDWFPVRFEKNIYQRNKSWTLDDGESALLTYDEPTHWMPLPKSPTEKESE